MAQSQPPNLAQLYQQYFVPAMFVPWADVLLRHARPEPGERALDVACGTGVVARAVAPLVGAAGRVAALDINPAMLEVARAQPEPQGAMIDWRQGSALALPFGDGAFDLVLCQHGLQFMPDRVKALAEMRRVLRPGGRAAVIVLQPLERHPIFAALGASVARQLGLAVEEVMLPFALGDAAALRDLCETAGFAQVDVRAETATALFREPARFAELAVLSSAAVVPAFAGLELPARAALIAEVAREIEPVVREHRTADHVTFPLFAHLVLARA